MLSGVSQVSTWNHAWRPPNLNLDPSEITPATEAVVPAPHKGRQVCPNGSVQCSFHPQPGNHPETGGMYISCLPPTLWIKPCTKLWDSVVLKHWRLGSKCDKNTQIEKLNALEAFCLLNKRVWQSSSSPLIGRANVSINEIHIAATYQLIKIILKEDNQQWLRLGFALFSYLPGLKTSRVLNLF